MSLNTNSFKLAFHQADQVVAQIKAGTQQSQVGIESLRNLLINIQNRTIELEQALKLATEKNHSLAERFNLSQKELQKADVRTRELEALAENYKRNLQESLIEHSRIVEQTKTEATKNLMIKQTFENYVDYAAKSTNEKIREFEEENKKLKITLNKREEQLKASLSQAQEAAQTTQTLTKREQDLQQQIKRFIAEKTIAQRSFEQRLQAAEQSLLKEKSSRKSIQDRVTPLEQEVQELRQLNESLKNTLKLDSIDSPGKAHSSNTKEAQPLPSEPQKEGTTPTHRIEETSDGAVLVWN